MKNPKLSYRYAKALFDFAKECDKVHEVYEAILMFSNTLRENRELQLFLRNPVVEPKQKHAIFESIFIGSLNDITYKFLEVLLKQRREPALDTICQEFVKLFNIENNIREVLITTAQPLSDVLRSKILALLTEQTKSTINLKELIDPEIVGGFIIQMNDHYIDHSVISKINKLKQEFSHNSFQVQF